MVKPWSRVVISLSGRPICRAARATMAVRWVMRAAAAESAADEGRDHMDIVGRHAELLRQAGLEAPHVLARLPHGQLAAVPGTGGGEQLDGVVVLGGGRIAHVDLHRRAGIGCLGVAHRRIVMTSSTPSWPPPFRHRCCRRSRWAARRHSRPSGGARPPAPPRTYRRRPAPRSVRHGKSCRRQAARSRCPCTRRRRTSCRLLILPTLRWVNTLITPARRVSHARRCARYGPWRWRWSPARRRRACSAEHRSRNGPRR